jgi:RNA polymerase sigma-70 factor (ECF subfamily)
MNPTLESCSGLEDSELVQKSLVEVNYFSCLYERYEAKLLRYVLCSSSFSEAEAEEVLQEAFVKAWRNLNSFDQTLKFSSWIYRIVHNEVISQWKKSHSFGKNQKLQIDDELFVNLPSSLDIAAEISQKVEAENIRDILNLLPTKYRDVLVLKFLEEKSYEEISDIMKKPAGTIATLINRAKKAFKELLMRNNNLDL